MTTTDHCLTCGKPSIEAASFCEKHADEIIERLRERKAEYALESWKDSVNAEKSTTHGGTP